LIRLGRFRCREGIVEFASTVAKASAAQNFWHCGCDCLSLPVQCVWLLIIVHDYLKIYVAISSSCFLWFLPNIQVPDV
jgi:hypothetical protein